MNILNAFLNGYFKQKTAETGRSMVEILGVLAVIGVLSAGGIYGYSFAMDKYRANDIVNEVNKRIQDTWHKYQDKPLPDSFDEWPDTTPTGFPINIVSSGNNLTFSVDVENVPNRVCQQVLNMNLNGFLAQMIRIVPTDINSEDGIVYQGNSSICSTYGDLSGMRFLATLEHLNGQGGTGKPLDKNGEPTTYCYTQQDCPSHKSGGCYDCINNLCEPDCAASTPYCMTTDISQHKCVECLCNDHCPKGAVCDEANNKCVQIEEECAPNHFRTKNGACMPCTTYSNIPVRTEPFEYMVDGEVVFKDDISGQAMCEQQCQDEGKFIVQTDTKDNNDDPITYCAYTCVDGYSYQSVGGCIKCSDKKSALLPDGIEKAKDQCVACGGIWYTDTGSNKTVCYMDECEKGKSFFNHWHETVRCRPCNASYDTSFERTYLTPCPSRPASDNKIASIAKEQCEACNRIYYDTGYRSWCTPVCKKGVEYRASWGVCLACQKDSIAEIESRQWVRIYDLEEAHELCRACGGDVFDKDCYFPCTRGQKWRNKSFKCIECHNSVAATETINNSDYEDLCVACGRDFVVENGVAHCKMKQGECKTGEFKNAYGVCIPCDTNLAQEEMRVTKPEDCTNACTGENGIAKRGITTHWESPSWYYCYKDCPNGYFSHYSGCKACSDNGSFGIGNGQFAKDECNSCPASNPRRANGTGLGATCERTTCPNDQFLNDVGQCVSCLSGGNHALTYSGYNHENNTYLEDKKAVCLACGNRTVVEQNGIFYCNRTSCYANQFSAQNTCTSCSETNVKEINTNEHSSCTDCGNRMVLDGKCVLIKAGEYGICNNHNNDTHGGYIAGEAKLFRGRDNNYKCELCTTDKAVFVGDDDVGREQCASCGGNRQFNNGYCILGDCTAGIDFKTKYEGCQRCDFTFGKFEIDNKDALECSSECDTNKFVQQIGTGDNVQYFCVNKPTENSFINADGVEVDCDDPSDVAIGIDSLSETFCRHCNRTPSNGVCLATS